MPDLATLRLTYFSRNLLAEFFNTIAPKPSLKRKAVFHVEQPHHHPQNADPEAE